MRFLTPSSSLALLLTLPALAACTKTADSVVVDHATPTWESFGGEVADGEFVPVADVLTDADANQGKTLRLEGDVESVCKKKGCWMTMRAGDEEMRVTFQDYGFFVPLDCEGRKVQMVGTFDVKMTPVDEARHYLEDAGKHEEAAKITEPQREYVFVATGVRMEPAAEEAASADDAGSDG
ncbi:MAG: DUF4920 domain-containing protein [Planctomycetota bacterium JB042]